MIEEVSTLSYGYKAVTHATWHDSWKAIQYALVLMSSNQGEILVIKKFYRCYLVQWYVWNVSETCSSFDKGTNNVMSNSSSWYITWWCPMKEKLHSWMKLPQRQECQITKCLEQVWNVTKWYNRYVWNMYAYYQHRNWHSYEKIGMTGQMLQSNHEHSIALVLKKRNG